MKYIQTNENTLKEFSLRVDEILYYVWDPIGIANSSPQSRNEYVNYSSDIFELMLTDAPIDHVIQMLTQIQEHYMKVGFNLDHNRYVAELLWSWKYYLLNEIKG